LSTQSVTFRTNLSSFGNNTGIEVPPELIEQLGTGKRPAVLVNVNGYEYRNTVGVMTGKYLVSVNAAVRKETGLTGGDPIEVTLTLATEPRPVDMPDENPLPLPSSPGYPTACSGITSIKLPPQKPKKPGIVESPRLWISSSPVRSADHSATRPRRISEPAGTAHGGTQGADPGAMISSHLIGS
jgi:hypothetical protein